MRLARVFVLASACAHNEPPPPVPLHWTDAKGEPVRDPGRSTDSIRWRESHRYVPERGVTTPHEPNVPRLRCNDGSRAIACTPGSGQGDCCTNQGGVFHDPWGNVLYE
jgi:hypothetical protein